MRMLILGGAWTLGRLIASGAATHGFEVTVFNGGSSTVNRVTGSAPATESIKPIRGDRRSADRLHELARLGPWDVVVDIDGKVPAVVRRSAQALKDVARQYVSVSANLVYRDWPHEPVDETSPLRPGDPAYDPGEWTFEPELYGSMKVGCELACLDAFGDDRVLILRLHEMIGQLEDDGPLLWWLSRMRRGGQVLVPGPDRPIQPIDVRDVAAFTVNLIANNVNGVFNVAAPPQNRRFSTMLHACAETVSAETTAPTDLIWADENWLLEKGVQQWIELPLWRSEPATWDINVDRALAAGLKCRPFTETASSTWQWMSTGDRRLDHPRFAKYGIDPACEADLIGRWLAAAR